MTTTTTNKVIWSDLIKIGNSDIDGQHKLLVELINSFYDVVINKLPTGQKKMEELEHYVQYHIQCEEGILLKAKYPDLADHQISHTELTSVVSDVVNRLLYLPVVDEQIELINSLQNFWINHIKDQDMQFKTHLSNSFEKNKYVA
ncbi:MAG: hypothetical protein HQK51_05660 [Oligoflexia bacterium]|nr:hypothetical protein [Oligoflexia bacterium]